MKKISTDFFERNDVVAIARELIGKLLVSQWNGERTSGRIVETEAYAGVIDKASHAYKGRTKRTEVMFGAPAHAYIYLCYGIHQMFNIVTGDENVAHAILIRALEPVEGVELMLKRTGKPVLDSTLTRGPGNVGRALGFHKSQSGCSLLGDEIFLLDDDFKPGDSDIGSSPRIGVDYAGEHAAWNYRFYLKGNPFVSGRIRN